MDFISRCMKSGRVLWTYHVNMRMSERSLTTADVDGAMPTFEVIETYPDDKYLPSYLVLGTTTSGPVHVVFGVDVEGDNVRVITAYRPNPAEWSPDFKHRRSSR